MLLDKQLKRPWLVIVGFRVRPVSAILLFFHEFQVSGQPVLGEMLRVISEKRLEQQSAEPDVITGPLQPWSGAGTFVAQLLRGIGTLGEVENRHRELADYGAAEGCVIVLIGSFILVKEAVNVPVVDFYATLKH